MQSLLITQNLLPNGYEKNKNDYKRLLQFVNSHMNNNLMFKSSQEEHSHST